MNTQIIGNITANAETRHTPSGKPVTNFDVAVNSGPKDKQETTFVRCALWGDRGEKLASYLTKGSFVVVNGELGTETYTKKDPSQGQGFAVTLNVSDVVLGGGGKNNSSGAAGNGKQEGDVF